MESYHGGSCFYPRLELPECPAWNGRSLPPSVGHFGGPLVPVFYLRSRPQLWTVWVEGSQAPYSPEDEGLANMARVKARARARAGGRGSWLELIAAGCGCRRI